MDRLSEQDGEMEEEWKDMKKEEDKARSGGGG
jgi:hypothetical protein